MMAANNLAQRCDSRSRLNSLWLRRSCLLLIAFTLSLLLNSAASRGQESTPGDASPEAIAFFESKIRPVLIEHCYECHSAEFEAEEGGLRVDDREALRIGGDSGPAVAPGSLENSKLIAAIRYGTDFYQMPPEGKLDDAVIADFVKWIETGAVDPRDPVAVVSEKPKAEIDWTQARNHWTFVPPAPQSSPATTQYSGLRDSSGMELRAEGPIDAFWLAKLSEKQIAPTAPLAKRELLRRLTFDLLGMPPTAEELNSFQQDSRPDATHRAVDRLLASPNYGERWGRHWLDVARYADSNGLDENLAYVNAFRYRDWVIQSFNRDMPYDEFVRWQIAGDRIESSPSEDPATSLDRLVATGFLSIGAKMLACDDGHKMELDIIDEQIDTLGKAVLGMTFGCARCHDHKFDPITQRDYYAMAGVFKSTHTMENFNVVAVWHEHELATPQQRQQRDEIVAQVNQAKSQRDAAITSSNQSLDQHWSERNVEYALALLEVGALDPREISQGRWSLLEPLSFDSLVAPDWKTEAEQFARGTLSVDDSHWGQGIGVLLHGGFAEYDIEITEPGTYQLELRYAAAESRPVTLSLDGAVQPGVVADKVTGGWPVENQRWHAERTLELAAGKHILRLEREGPVPHIDKIALIKLLPPSEQRQEIATSRGLRETIFGDLIAAWFHSDRATYREQLRAAWEQDRAALEARVRDAFSASPMAPSENDSLREALSAIRNLGEPKNPAHPGDDRSRWFLPEETQSIAQLSQQVAELEQRIPKFELAMGVREGQASDLPIHIRGNYLTLGPEAVPRGWPYVLTNIDSKTQAEPTESGRLGLAHWITRADHPLTSRVIVNRLWRWHFGKGIVPTPDNFGLLGLPPSHPELLDYLAVDLLENDWSLKRLHRQILTSRLYQTGSRFDSEANEHDPENTTFWHVPRRRLSAEEMRDSLLQVSMGLDQKMYGSMLRSDPRAYVSGPAQSPDTYASRRRSVYLPILRSAVYDVLQAFDFPDPAVSNGDRATSTIAPQALFALNSAVVVEAGDRLAEAAIRHSELPQAQANFLATQILARPIQPDELARTLAAVERYTEQQRVTANVESASGEQLASWHRRSLSMVARVLMASNEFAFVD